MEGDTNRESAQEARNSSGGKNLFSTSLDDFFSKNSEFLSDDHHTHDEHTDEDLDSFAGDHNNEAINVMELSSFSDDYQNEMHEEVSEHGSIASLTHLEDKITSSGFDDETVIDEVSEQHEMIEQTLTFDMDETREDDVVHDEISEHEETADQQVHEKQIKQEIDESDVTDPNYAAVLVTEFYKNKYNGSNVQENEQTAKPTLLSRRKTETLDIRKCLKDTLEIFAQTIVNRVSLVAAPEYGSKLNDWLATLEENNVDINKMLDFFIDEAENFAKKIEDAQKVNTLNAPIKAQGLELASNIFVRKQPIDKSLKRKASKPISSVPAKRMKVPKVEPVDENESYATNYAEQTATSQSVRLKPVKVEPEVTKKRNPIKCRSCREKFVPAYQGNFICSKEKCRKQNCPKCDVERVISGRTGVCQACNKSKSASKA